ncbi:class A beta-lactamase BOR-1 [Streptomyces sannanensis]|uniref:Class A beta-lactamase BOR-1 n=1 Tax=Streptomyces sannanensis TaxID=285536 RepID=A0ABP6SAN1_9ACTN
MFTAGPARADARRGHRHQETTARLRELEQQHAARIGVFARNLATNATVLHRAEERFPLCSLFKPLAAAAVLRDLDRDGETLAKRIHYTSADVVENSEITSREDNLANGMTIAELSEAAICHSDNTAGNLMLRELGGPTAITRFCRSIQDNTTRLDRWEPTLNSAEPWRVEDTTSPRAIARSYAKLVLGDVLDPLDRGRLTEWLLNNQTSGDRFRAVLAGWTVADKTGGGSYGTNNNVGIAWTPDGAPVVLAVLTTKHEADALPDSPLVARTAALAAEALA